jgi:hypothetical protein
MSNPSDRTRPPSAPPAPGGAALGERWHREVVAEVRRRIAASPSGFLVNGRLPDLEIALRISMADAAAGGARLAAAVESGIAAFVAEVIEAATAFRPGRAFCHRCGGADCVHATPPKVRDVFAGYLGSGAPRWTDFGQVCLDLRHPRVDRLYDEARPEVLQIEIDGRSLVTDLLPEIERPAARQEIAGQVCAGFFPIPGLPAAERGLAITLQLVLTSDGRRGRRVGLNLIAGGEAGEAAVAAASPESKPWRAALLWGQAECAELTRRAAGAGMPDEVLRRRLMAIRIGLRRRIEQDLKGRGRRTLHAEERHRGGERPTRKAIDDLRAAGPEAAFVDTRHDTFVIVGPRNRAHFFSSDGLLVSSLHCAKETIARKLRIGQWRAADAEGLRRLRAKVEKTTTPEA